jgi:hypothetical protein
VNNDTGESLFNGLTIPYGPSVKVVHVNTSLDLVSGNRELFNEPVGNDGDLIERS